MTKSIRDALRIESGAFPVHAFDDKLFKPFVNYLSTQTDAPEEFLYCAALMTVQAAIGNRVYCQTGRQQVKTNLYLLLLAGSTVARKSTAVNIVKHYGRELENTVNAAHDDFIPMGACPVGFLMPDSGSLEGLIESMRAAGFVKRYEGKGKDRIEVEEPEHKNVLNSGTAVYSEFAGFVDMIQREYNKGYESFILDVYDGQDHKRTLKREQSYIKNPCLSIFGASTMTQFRQRIREDDKHTGYLQRFMFCHVPESARKRSSLVEIGEPDRDKELWFVEALKSVYLAAKQLHDHQTPFRLSDDARAVYQGAFEEDQKYIKQLSANNTEFAGMLDGYFGRLDVMKIKVALIFAVVERVFSRDGSFPSVSGDAMKRAVDVIGYFQRSTERLLQDEFKFGKFDRQVKQIIDKLRAGGGSMRRRDLQNGLRWNSKEFNEVLQSGIDSGLWDTVDEKEQSGQTSKRVQLCVTR
jgi:hypothetical protein